MAPIIGITAGRIRESAQIVRICLIEKYIEAIQIAGGIPVILPVGISKKELHSIQNNFDGFLITGGGDIAIDRFNGEQNPKISDVDPVRDEFEIELARNAFRTDKPLFGICRGHQVINVAMGGSLITDISSQYTNAIKHDWYPEIPRNYEAHSIQVAEKSLLRNILSGADFQVNSLHHQAIKQIGANLVATAFAPDGIIEAVENPTHRFFLGIQWHPEWMLSTPAMVNIFKSFVSASENNHERN
ncbi:MAG: hypothetical protein CVU46_08435 [Chloroflexi bacterium HGW-Chloroflexi-8]|nr:MAG: hypothetical protein CVU46_08435 [Chloroflexi bacterium HGW-Chloroflexi-8]